LSDQMVKCEGLLVIFSDDIDYLWDVHVSIKECTLVLLNS
jgi:hypothetical protein